MKKAKIYRNVTKKCGQQNAKNESILQVKKKLLKNSVTRTLSLIPGFFLECLLGVASPSELVLTLPSLGVLLPLLIPDSRSFCLAGFPSFIGVSDSVSGPDNFGDLSSSFRSKL